MITYVNHHGARSVPVENIFYFAQATAFFSWVTAFSVGLPFFSWVTQFSFGVPLYSEEMTILSEKN